MSVRCNRDHEGIAVLAIERPERRNALNLEVKGRLADEVDALAADATVRVIVLTGSGGYFVAGTDLAEMLDMTPEDHTRLNTGRVFSALRQCAKPVIAAVEGYALGGGCELALCCDLIVAGSSARFGQPEIRVGIMPGAGGTQKLTRIMGPYRAMKLILTGEAVAAPEALQLGMLSEVVPDGTALERALDLARTIASMPPLAVRAVKEVVRAGQNLPLDGALALERKAFQLLFDTKDQKEGMRAFLEKRKPVFRGQ